MSRTARLWKGAGSLALGGLLLSGVVARGAEPPPLSRQLTDLGRQAMSQGETAHARTFFQKAVQLDPNNVERVAALGRLGGVRRVALQVPAEPAAGDKPAAEPVAPADAAPGDKPAAEPAAPAEPAASPAIEPPPAEAPAPPRPPGRSRRRPRWKRPPSSPTSPGSNWSPTSVSASKRPATWSTPASPRPP